MAKKGTHGLPDTAADKTRVLADPYYVQQAIQSYRWRLG